MEQNVSTISEPEWKNACSDLISNKVNNISIILMIKIKLITMLNFFCRNT